MKTLLFIAMCSFVAVSPLYADSYRERVERDRREREARIEANNRERERLNRERTAIIRRFNDIPANADFNRAKNDVLLATQAFADNPRTRVFVNFTNRIANIIMDYRKAYKEAAEYAANPDSVVISAFRSTIDRVEYASRHLNRELDAFAIIRNEHERMKRMAEQDAALKEAAEQAETNRVVTLSRIRNEEANEEREREEQHRRRIESMAIAASNEVARIEALRMTMEAESKHRLAELDLKTKAESEEAAKIREEKRQEEAKIREEEHQFQLELARIQSGRGGSSSMLLLFTLLSAFVSLGIGCGVGFVVWGRRREAK